MWGRVYRIEFRVFTLSYAPGPSLFFIFVADRVLLTHQIVRAELEFAILLPQLPRVQRLQVCAATLSWERKS